MKRRIFLEEYMEFYIPVFSHLFDSLIFCDDRKCSECVFDEECDKNPFTDEEEYEDLKISNPEYFI